MKDLLGADAQTQGATPRTPTAPQSPPPSVERVTFDLPELDVMLGGGIPRTTCTLLAGSLGTGKTLLAMHYALAGVRAGDPVVYLGFRENGEQLLQAAAPFAIGPAFVRALAPGGGITFLQTPPVKVNPDILADRLLDELDRTQARRLVIDSIAELERGLLRSGDPLRLEDYLAALLLALRESRVTALMLKETDKAVTASLDFSADALSILAENVLLLQQVPFRGELHRIFSVLKLRFSAHDPSLREFRIAAPAGLQVLGRVESASGVLEGITVDQERATQGGGQRRRVAPDASASSEGEYR